MPFKYLNIVQRISVGIYSLTSSLVCLLGLFVIVPIFNSNPYDEHLGQRSRFERGPASVVSFHDDLAAKATLDRKMVVYDLECVQEGALQPIESKARQIRIRGRWCGTVAESLQTSSILNRTNGFQATMFNLRKGHFTSDYISLEAGTNKIVVQLQVEEGQQKTTELTVIRQ